MEIICSYCGCKSDKPTGIVNRANRQGKKLFCNRTCAGIGRRSNLSHEEKRAEKSNYDRIYRDKNKDILKSKKQEYFKRTYNPDEARMIRKKNMPRHVAYCRRPDYRAKKKNYDKQYLAKKNYGEYWESHLLIEAITKEYDNREVKSNNNLIGKSQKRKREWKTQQAHNLQLPR